MSTKKKMPARGARDAPRFDEHKDRIDVFLEEFEAVAEECGLDDDEKIKAIRRYTDTKTAFIWERIEVELEAGSKETKWTKWKKELEAMYRMEPQAVFSTAAMEATIEKYKTRAREADGWTAQLFTEFHREIVGFCAHKIKSGELTDKTAAEKYLNAFEGPFRDEIHRRLDHVLDFTNKYTVSVVKDAVYLLITRKPISTPVQSTPAAPVVKTEPMWGAAVAKLAEKVDLMASTQVQLQQTVLQLAAQPRYAPQPAAAQQFTTATTNPPAAYNPGTYNPAAYNPGTYNTGQTRVQRCHYCRSPSHLRLQCPDFQADEAAGLCRLVAGRVQLPNGQEPPFEPGRSFRDLIRDYHKQQQQHQPSAPTASISESPSMLFEAVRYVSGPAYGSGESMMVSGEPVERGEEDTELREKEADLMRSLEAFVQAKVSKGGRTGAEAAVPRVTRQAAAKAKEEANGKGKDGGSSKVVGGGKDREGGGAGGGSMGPGYKFRTQIEVDNEGVAQLLGQRLLEDTITLKKSELLAVAPDVRRFIKDMTTTKKVPAGTTVGDSANGSLTTFFTDGPGEFPTFGRDDEGRVTSTDTLPLRAVTMDINGAGSFEAVLDIGSSFVAISRRAWERLGLSMRDDIKMQMENANAGRSLTLGMMHNARATIGGLEFLLQIFVVETTAFDILLGLPFFALARSEISFQADGTAALKLQDPNSGRHISMPTRARDKGKSPAGTLGF